jgi:hypothetical protein
VNEDGRDLTTSEDGEFSSETDHDDTGTMERIHDTVLNIDVGVSSLEAGLRLEKEDIEEALEQACKICRALSVIMEGGP